MKPQAAFVVSVARGLVISGILIMVLPTLLSADAIWLAMPVTELLVMLYPLRRCAGTQGSCREVRRQRAR